MAHASRRLTDSTVQPRAERPEQEGDAGADGQGQHDVHGAEHERPAQDLPEVGVAQDLAEVVQAHRLRRGAELLGEAELLRRQHAEAHERVAQDHDHDGRRRQEQDVLERLAPPAGWPAAPGRRPTRHRVRKRAVAGSSRGWAGRRSLVQRLLDEVSARLASVAMSAPWAMAGAEGLLEDVRPSTDAQFSPGRHELAVATKVAWASAAGGAADLLEQRGAGGQHRPTTRSSWNSSPAISSSRSIASSGFWLLADTARLNRRGTRVRFADRRAGEGEHADVGFHLGASAAIGWPSSRGP